MGTASAPVLHTSSCSLTFGNTVLQHGKLQVESDARHGITNGTATCCSCLQVLGQRKKVLAGMSTASSQPHRGFISQAGLLNQVRQHLHIWHLHCYLGMAQACRLWMYMHAAAYHRYQNGDGMKAQLRSCTASSAGHPARIGNLPCPLSPSLPVRIAPSLPYAVLIYPCLQVPPSLHRKTIKLLATKATLLARVDAYGQDPSVRHIIRPCTMAMAATAWSASSGAMCMLD